MIKVTRNYLVFKTFVSGEQKRRRDADGFWYSRP